MTATSTNALSVMIVDDDADIREIVGEILADAGYTFAVAENGVEALAKLKVTSVGLILLDLNMPVMDGFEFRRLQRADADASRVPTVVMSAVHQMRERIADLAFDAVIDKPVGIRRLLELVASHCGPPPNPRRVLG